MIDQERMKQVLICPKCKNTYEPTDLFCRVCGQKINNKTLSVSLSKQISVYAISLLLPPFGLIPAIKYLRQGDDKSKKIGMIAIALTVISGIFSIIILKNFMDTFNSILGGQMSGYQDFTF